MFSLTQYARFLKLLAAHPRSSLYLTGGISNWTTFMRETEKKKNSFRIPDVLRADGFDIRLHPNDIVGVSGEIVLFGGVEPETTALFRKLLKKNMTIVDVGANIGWYSLLAAKRVGKRGRVLSFEPEPSNCDSLRESLQDNGFDNVLLFQECLSNHNGVERLYLSEIEPGRHSIVWQVGEKWIDVRCSTLDARLRENNVDDVDILKIDAEGAEPGVLEGARNLIDGNRCSHIVMEWNQGVWHDHKDLLHFLFEHHIVFKNTRSPFLIRRITEEEIWKPSTWQTGVRNVYMKSRR